MRLPRTQRRETGLRRIALGFAVPNEIDVGRYCGQLILAIGDNLPGARNFGPRTGRIDLSALPKRDRCIESGLVDPAFTEAAQIQRRRVLVIIDR